MSDDAYDNRPLSEIYRVTAKRWVEAESIASLLEETKSSVLQQNAQKLVAEFDISGAEAERRAKADPAWIDWIKAMCAAREKALLLKCQIEYIKMRFQEQASAEANARAEMRL